MSHFGEQGTQGTDPHVPFGGQENRFCVRVHRRNIGMEENEILLIYGTDYVSMTEKILEQAALVNLIQKKYQKKAADRGETMPSLSDMRIGIKPNLVAPIPAEDGGTTHPEVVEGLLRYLRRNGFTNLVILESSWVGDRTEDAFLMCGYYDLAETYQVELVDMKKVPKTEIDCAGMKLMVGKPAEELDFLINVPVLKGHCQTKMTCALKNLKGLLPDSQKRAFHRMGLHDPIGHLSAGIHQDFILVDSICGDLSFEDGGNPVQQDRLLAARDPVLCDAYCCKLLGIPVETVPYISVAEACGCGNADLSKAGVRELNQPIREIDLSGVGKALQLSQLAEEVDACSACYGSLIPALHQLEMEGLLDKLQEKICIGQGNRGKSGVLGVGNCTSGFQCYLEGCPPTREEIFDFLKKYLQSSQRVNPD